MDRALRLQSYAFSVFNAVVLLGPLLLALVAYYEMWCNVGGQGRAGQAGLATH